MKVGEPFNPNELYGGLLIPNVILNDKNLSSQEKIILSKIIVLSDNDNKHCTASNKYFSEFMNLSKGRVSTIINNLFRKGYLLIFEARRGKQVMERITQINYEKVLKKV